MPQLEGQASAEGGLRQPLAERRQADVQRRLVGRLARATRRIPLPLVPEAVASEAQAGCGAQRAGPRVRFRFIDCGALARGLDLDVAVDGPKLDAVVACPYRELNSGPEPALSKSVGKCVAGGEPVGDARQSYSVEPGFTGEGQQHRCQGSGHTFGLRAKGP